MNDGEIKSENEDKRRQENHTIHSRSVNIRNSKHSFKNQNSNRLASPGRADTEDDSQGYNQRENKNLTFGEMEGRPREVPKETQYFRERFENIMLPLKEETERRKFHRQRVQETKSKANSIFAPKNSQFVDSKNSDQSDSSIILPNDVRPLIPIDFISSSDFDPHVSPYRDITFQDLTSSPVKQSEVFSIRQENQEPNRVPEDSVLPWDQLAGSFDQERIFIMSKPELPKSIKSGYQYKPLFYYMSPLKICVEGKVLFVPYIGLVSDETQSALSKPVLSIGVLDGSAGEEETLKFRFMRGRTVGDVMFEKFDCVGRVKDKAVRTEDDDQENESQESEGDSENESQTEESSIKSNDEDESEQVSENENSQKVKNLATTGMEQISSSNIVNGNSNVQNNQSVQTQSNPNSVNPGTPNQQPNNAVNNQNNTNSSNIPNSTNPNNYNSQNYQSAPVSNQPPATPNSNSPNNQPPNNDIDIGELGIFGSKLKDEPRHDSTQDKPISIVKRVNPNAESLQKYQSKAKNSLSLGIFDPSRKQDLQNRKFRVKNETSILEQNFRLKQNFISILQKIKDRGKKGQKTQMQSLNDLILENGQKDSFSDSDRINLEVNEFLDLFSGQFHLSDLSYIIQLLRIFIITYIGIPYIYYYKYICIY